MGNPTTFSTSDIYDLFMDYVRRYPESNFIPLSSITMKRLSGDLDRLYKMGFLKRRRSTRHIRQKSSFPFSRGFQYLYQVSKQGWQYSAYLQKDKGESQEGSADERFRAEMTDRMYQMFHRPLAEFVEGQVYPTSYNYRGRHNRFPREKYDELLLSLRQCKDELRRSQVEINRLREFVGRSSQQLHKP